MSEDEHQPLDSETEHRIEDPVSAEALRETRLTPAEAVDKMHINLPVRGNRKLRRLMEFSSPTACPGSGWTPRWRGCSASPAPRRQT